MKTLLFILCICLSLYNLYGQEFYFSTVPDSILQRFDDMGIDNSDTLTDIECCYFMYRFAKPDTEYDFSGKRIKFINARGNGKIFFFSEEKRLLNTNKNRSGMVAAIYFFDESEKQLYGFDYDIVIDCWAKFQKSKKTIAKHMK